MAVTELSEHASATDRLYSAEPQRTEGGKAAMAARSWSNVAALVALAWAHGAIAQDQQPKLTPVGEVILQSEIARNSQLLQNPTGQNKPLTFPLAMCTFPVGLCGAVRSDGSVAVPPRYD